MMNKFSGLLSTTNSSTSDQTKKETKLMLFNNILGKSSLIKTRVSKKENQLQLLREEEEQKRYKEYEKHEALYQTIITPDPSKNPWNQASVGRYANGQEVIIDFNLTPTVFTQGAPGSGKTVLYNTIINHCLSHTDHWEVIVFDVSNFNDFSYLETPSNARSFKILRNKVDIVTTIQRLYNLWQLRTQPNVPHFEHILVPIGDFDYLKAEITREQKLGTFAHEHVSEEEGRDALSKLQTLIQVGGSHGIHFIIDSYSDEFDDTVRRSIAKGTIKHLGFGKELIKRKVKGFTVQTITGMGVELDTKSNDGQYFKGYVSEKHNDYVESLSRKSIRA